MNASENSNKGLSRRNLLKLTTGGALASLAGISRGADAPPRVCDSPPLDASPMRFCALPSGAIRPTGFWRRTAETIAEGWLRMVFAKDDDNVVTPYIVRNAFVGGYADGHTEGAGYVADAIVRFAHLLPDSTVGRGKRAWLDRILQTQDEDGYLGCSSPANRFRGGFELWSVALLLQTLICDYEATSDRRTLDAALRLGRWIAREVESGKLQGVYSGKDSPLKSRQASHSVYCIIPLYRLWHASGDERFRRAAVYLLNDYEASGSKLTSQAFLRSGEDGFREHIVGISMQIQVMAYAALLTGESRYLEAAKAIERKLANRGLSASGIIAGNEFTHKAGPRKWSEHCGAVEWTISHTEMVAFTGDVAYADAAERCMWNAYFGAKNADATRLAYNSAPNQILAANTTGAYEDNEDQAWYRSFYSAKHLYGCCNYNTSRAFPNFVQRAAMVAPDRGPVVVLYGSWTLEENGWGLALQTDYPFSDDVRIEIDRAPINSAPLRLRIPAWCKSASLSVNGSASEQKLVPGTFAVVNRKLKAGDTLDLRFEVPFEFEVYDGSFASVPGFALRRGPLTFVLPVPHTSTAIELHDPWCPEFLRMHRNLLPKENALWNVAFDVAVDDPTAGLALRRETLPPGSLPWGVPPVSVEVPVRVVSNWSADRVSGHITTPALPHPPMEYEPDRRIAKFVPYGFTETRMTYLPMVGVENLRRFPWGKVELTQEK